MTSRNDTRYINPHAPIPDKWQRSVHTVGSIAIGWDLHLYVHEVRTTAFTERSEARVHTGHAVELFDGGGNYLATVAVFTSYTSERVITPVWDQLPALISMVLSWPWTESFVQRSGGKDLPFEGL